ncbi:MAG: putative sulfate exporter family transporter [Labilithrix sp.]|nr:putative sulfate exporter family transporter [Labilithrix sp.]MCW5815125.1 putative sulfate exporter family transporter [Labilithrix sp.]
MRRPQWIPTRSDVPGVLLALVIGGASVGLVKALPSSPLISDVLVALFLGALVLNVPPLARLAGLGHVGKEREPDRYASGLRFTGKWLLRLSIVLMGLKVQTGFFGRTEIETIFIVAGASIPSTFFFAHVLGVALRVRRPLVDLLAGGTMICGASAVNAIAPAARAHRDEQGVAIAVVFLFSVTAMLSFRTLAFAFGLDASFAGLWSGLAVNDLASAIAVGAQMGEAGGVMAAASKSARILLLAPVLVSIALARRSNTSTSAKKGQLTKSVVDALPAFIVGYVALALVRVAGDRAFAGAPAWASFLAADKLVVDVLMSTVSAGIGLHLDVRSVLASSARAVGVGAGASVWMAGLTLAMIVLLARGHTGVAIALGAAALLAAVALHRVFAGEAAKTRAIERRFEEGQLLTLEECTVLLEQREAGSALDDTFLRRLLDLLSPSIGELIPARTSPLGHGEGCRWLTYWEGKTGWALVAVVREPGSVTPIHAHPHRMLGKAIEGRLEELRFKDVAGGVELTAREVLAHEQLVEAEGLASLHVVRAVGDAPAIDIQLRGPEVGKPGRLLRPARDVDVLTLPVGARIDATEEIDARPGQSGDGAAAGRAAT